MELAYKVGFGVVFVGLLSAAARAARELRQRPEGRVSQTAHELPALRVIRPALGLVFYAALADWLVSGTRLEWAYLRLSPLVRGGGFVACSLAVGVLWVSFASLGASYRGGLGLWDDHALVLTGPYALVRHPIYASFVVFTLGVGALSASWLAGTAGVALTLMVPALRLRIEEHQLRERFGTAYAEYERTTPRFVPRIR